MFSSFLLNLDENASWPSHLNNGIYGAMKNSLTMDVAKRTLHY